jgi:hypothetical protein
MDLRLCGEQSWLGSPANSNSTSMFQTRASWPPEVVTASFLRDASDCVGILVRIVEHG